MNGKGGTRESTSFSFLHQNRKFMPRGICLRFFKRIYTYVSIKNAIFATLFEYISKSKFNPSFYCFKWKAL